MAQISTTARFAGLDGLRAIAVLMVIGDHLLPKFAGGGIGVNIFFVLSGYLITTLLVRERQRLRRIHLRLFYLRRVLRLYPALLAMLLLTAIISGAAGQALVAALYATNIFDVMGVDPGPYGHTWSLAAEEQFYLVWPPVLIAAYRFRRSLITLVAVLAVASIVACVLGTALLVEQTGGITNAVFNPLWQAHGLLAGVLLALITGTYSRPMFRIAHPNAVSWSALGAILAIAVGASVTVDAHIAAEWNVLAEVAAAFLILGLLESTGFVGWLFNNPVAVWIGARSYALYLWHAPVFVLLLAHGANRLLIAFIGVPLSFALAWASGRWVEAPFLRLKDRLHPRQQGASIGPKARIDAEGISKPASADVSE